MSVLVLKGQSNILSHGIFLSPLLQQSGSPGRVGILQFLSHLMCLSLNCGGKLQNPGRTYADSGMKSQTSTSRQQAVSNGHKPVDWGGDRGTMKPVILRYKNSKVLVELNYEILLLEYLYLPTEILKQQLHIMKVFFFLSS